MVAVELQATTMAALLSSSQPLQKPGSPAAASPRRATPPPALPSTPPPTGPSSSGCGRSSMCSTSCSPKRMDPDPALLCTLIHSCAEEGDLQVARMVHARISGEAGDAFVAKNLINMYAKCGDPVSVRGVFDGMPVRNAVSWTTVISMYSLSGWPREALRLYRAMKRGAGVVPNAFTLATVLNSLAKVGNLKMGVKVHEDVVRNGPGLAGWGLTTVTGRRSGPAGVVLAAVMVVRCRWPTGKLRGRWWKKWAALEYLDFGYLVGK